MTTRPGNYPAYVCWHEAGHAVAAAMLCGGFRYARVAPRGGTLPLPRGMQRNIPAGYRAVCKGAVNLGAFRHIRAKPVDWATVYLAGWIADSMPSRKALTASPSAHCFSDIEATEAVCGDDRDLIAHAIKVARSRIRQWWPQIERVAAHLLREGVLFGRDFERVANP